MSDFAPHGRLGLIAVTLQAGITDQGVAAAQLGLVVSRRVFDPQDANLEAYSVAAVQLKGYATGSTFVPRFYPRSYLRHALGLTDRVIGCHPYYSECLDDHLGFGATNSLADALPKMGAYFTALAQSLSAQHLH